MPRLSSDVRMYMIIAGIVLLGIGAVAEIAIVGAFLLAGFIAMILFLCVMIDQIEPPPGTQW